MLQHIPFFTYRRVLCLVLLGLTAAAPAAWGQGFDPVAVYPAVAGSRPFGLALGDVNGDGLLDIVAGDNNGNAPLTSVLLGQPGGRFGAAAAYLALPGSWDLTLGDVNRDGRLDAVMGCNGAAQAAVQLGQANGFGALSPYQAGAGIVHGVALGDVNDDGWPDIVLANIGTNSVNVLWGQANGFAPSTRYNIGSDHSPLAVALGDMNGDGRLDIVTGNAKSSTIGVLLGQAGGFAPVTTYSAFRNVANGTTTYFMGIALADVDGDGRLDVVTTTQDALSGLTLGVLLGQPTGLGTITHYPTAGLLSHSVAVGDVNGDAWPDIVLTSSGANAVGVLLGYPGGFSAAFQYSTGPNSTPYSVKLGDVNRDGRLDIVTTNSTSSSVGVLLNASPPPLALTSALPSSGAVGSTVQLDGSNLQGAVAVVFGGASNHAVSSGFAVNAAGTQITGIVVPSGASSGRVRVVTPRGTVTSNASFSVLTPTAMQSGSAGSALALYPNPTRARSVLSLPAASTDRPVLLLNALSQTVRQLVLPAQADEVTLDVAALPAGIYTVRCGAVTSRLVLE